MAFDPSKKHPLYEKWVKAWQRQRDALDGEDTVKESPRSREYLPPLSGQNGQLDDWVAQENELVTYGAYKARAQFMNATGRTRDSLVGAIMRKDPVIEWPESESKALDIIGYSYESWDELTHMTLDEVIGIGRYGQLVDSPQEEGADPYVSTYIAETITDWERGEYDGRSVPVRVNLAEPSVVTDKDQELEVYRVLRLGVPEPETQEELDAVKDGGEDAFLRLFGLRPSDFKDGPVYFQEMWVQMETANGAADESQFERVSVVVPRKAGGALWREIPFSFFNPTSTRPKPEKPTLLDLTVVNFSHYRNSADLEHGLHFTALPQPWTAGFEFKKAVSIGSAVVWSAEDPNAKAAYLEFSGAGLGAVEKRMEAKKKEMASLGARLLEEQKSDSEAAETVRLRHSGEGSALARLARAVSAGLTQTLGFIAEFRGTTGSHSTALNEDFGTEGLEPDMLRALMEQVQSGLISWETYMYNLRRGELLSDRRTDEEEAAAILVGPPGQSVDALLNPVPAAGPQVDEEDDSQEDDDE